MGKNNDSNTENENTKIDLTTQIAQAAMPHTALGPSVIPASQIVTGSGTIALDLVVIIDTSGSMSDESADLSKQIDAAIEKASTHCPSQLRATFLGIQGTWSGTKFDQTVSDYLIAHGTHEGDLQARPPFKELDGVDHAGNKEDLCRAVIDVANHFDWRSNTRRAIFVLGDEGMEGGGGVLTQAAVTKNNEAIAVAQSALVKVYTYQGTPNDEPTNIDRFPTLADRDKVTKEYERLAKQTGGRAYIYTTGIANFALVLQEILCDSLTPPPKLPEEVFNCDSVCEQLPLIIGTVNKLADIINKTINSCCPPEADKHMDPPVPCGCKH